MKYKDLSYYENNLSNPIKRIKNVGWISSDTDFLKSDSIDSGLIDKLKSLTSLNGELSFRFNQIKGYEPCSICKNIDLKHAVEVGDERLGSCEILIPNIEGDGYFACPEFICHYILHHGYQPPVEFLNAVRKLDLSEPFDAESIYLELLMNS